jgi:hypothetical protein
MVQLNKTKTEIIRKTGELAVEYEKKYSGCCQCVFLAIVDTLRWGGVEVATEDMEDRLFPGLCLLTGGVGVTIDGTCGAIIGGVMAIGMSMGVTRNVQGKDMSIVGDGLDIVWRYVMDRCDEKYRSQLCKEIQKIHYGQFWDFRIPEATDEYLKVSDGCKIKEISMWSMEAILDEFEQRNLI